MNEKDIHNPSELITDWKTALGYLKSGNKRYLEGQTITRNDAKDREALKDSQKPFAIILTCSDSRTPPEIFLDQKLGDLFVIRNAGNTADTAAMGSIEYAAKFLKAPLVVVAGHSCCGAVIAAFNGGDFPENLTAVLGTINPAVKGCGNADDAIRANTGYVVNLIKENKIIKEMGTTVTGAHYDITTGEVTFDL